jgi:hypothetical protein
MFLVRVSHFVPPIKFLKTMSEEVETEKKWKFGTKAVHSGQSPDPISGALMTPIV